MKGGCCLNAVRSLSRSSTEAYGCAVGGTFPMTTQGYCTKIHNKFSLPLRLSEVWGH